MCWNRAASCAPSSAAALREDPALEAAYLGGLRGGGVGAAMAFDLILRGARIAGRARRRRRHRHRRRPHRRDRARALAGDAPSRSARAAALVAAGLRRDPHPSRQVLHHRPLHASSKARCRRRSPRPRAPSAPSPRRTSTPARGARWRRRSSPARMHMRTHVEVDPRIGLQGLPRHAPAQARLRLGDRPARSASFRRRG